MMARLTERARAIGARRAAEAREVLVTRIDLPGVAVSIEEEAVVLSGRGLRRRMLTEPVLGWIGSVFR